MRYTKLGRSGLGVSRVAFGTWQLGGDWGPTDEEQAIAAIRRAADRGVTLFDTAQGYGFGASERLLAKALAGRPRDAAIIATKGGLRPEGGGVARDSSPSWIRQGIEESLRALDTDYIDLYQVHWPDPKTPFEETASALADQVAGGKIRHVGVSNFDVTEMKAFSETLPVETLQPPYDLFRRDIEADVLPYTAANAIGVLVYGPLAHGLLSGQLHEGVAFPPGDWRASSGVFEGDAFHRNVSVVDDPARLAAELGITLGQLAVAWTLANPAVDVAIVGTRNPNHVDEAVGAASIDLSADTLARIEEMTAPAIAVVGPSPEGMPRDWRGAISERKRTMEKTTDLPRSPNEVTVLGAGTMGSAMVRRLLGCGFGVGVWNRNPDPLRPLAHAGAQTFSAALEAVRGAPVVLTLLPTIDVVREVMVASGVLEAMAPGQVWAQMGTIGVEGTLRMAEEVRSRQPGVLFVDAPVSGSRAPAESGELVILASGPENARAIVDPVFDALGHRTLWLGSAGRGSQMKLVLNTWLAFEVEAAAEVMSLATHWDIADETLENAISGSPLVSPYAASKLKKMQSGDDSADFSLGLALKDLHLVEEAVGPGRAPIAGAIAERWRKLAERGDGGLDVSAARLGLGPVVAARP